MKRLHLPWSVYHPVGTRCSGGDWDQTMETRRMSRDRRCGRGATVLKEEWRRTISNFLFLLHEQSVACLTVPENLINLVSMFTDLITGMSTKCVAVFRTINETSALSGTLTTHVESRFRTLLVAISTLALTLCSSSSYVLKCVLSNSGEGLWQRDDWWVHRSRSTILLCQSMPLTRSVSTPSARCSSEATATMEPGTTVQIEVTCPNIRTVSDSGPHMKPAPGLIWRIWTWVTYELKLVFPLVYLRRYLTTALMHMLEFVGIWCKYKHAQTLLSHQRENGHPYSTP